MSHFTEIKVDFQQKHEKELVAALREIFGEEVEVHDNAVELMAYTGAAASRAGLGKTEKCHVVIRQEELRAAGGGCTNDAGYMRTEDGKYRVFIDSAGFTTTQQNKVAQAYATKVSTKELTAQGYQVRQIKGENGTIRLEAKIWS